jgi:2'-5' RNA ligase
MAAIPGKHVFYLALQPTAEAAAAAAERLEAVRREHRLTGRPVAANRLHVSLFNLGTFKRPPGPIIEKAVDVVRRVEARRFIIGLNRLASWGRGDGERPVVLWGEDGVIGVQALYEALHRELVTAGMASRRDPPFEPHMTLLYDRAAVPETFVDPVEWRVVDFVLIHAVHGEGRFQVVERFPLAG